MWVQQTTLSPHHWRCGWETESHSWYSNLIACCNSVSTPDNTLTLLLIMCVGNRGSISALLPHCNGASTPDNALTLTLMMSRGNKPSWSWHSYLTVTTQVQLTTLSPHCWWCGWEMKSQSRRTPAAPPEWSQWPVHPLPWCQLIHLLMRLTHAPLRRVPSHWSVTQSC